MVPFVFFKRIFSGFLEAFSGILVLQQRRQEIPIESERAVYTQLLRARQKQQKELRTISKHLNIHPYYLKALEEGRYETLSRPVALTHIVTYARYLQLDVDKIVEQFQEEWPAPEEEVTSLSFAHNHLSRYRFLILIPALLLFFWALSFLKSREGTLVQTMRQEQDSFEPPSLAFKDNASAGSAGEEQPVHDANNNEEIQTNILTKADSLGEP